VLLPCRLDVAGEEDVGGGVGQGDRPRVVVGLGEELAKRRRDFSMDPEGINGGDMATDATLGNRFLEELYGMTDGQATKVVRGEDLVRRLGMDPEEEIDKARFLGTARRLEEEGYVIANKTGPNVRDYSSLSLTHAGIRVVKESRPA
jgi:hypothetical protein